jgi:PleD family two-component response regulator
VLERLRLRACATPIAKGNISVIQSVSAGIPQSAVEEPPLAAVVNADQALFRAKSQGRNRIVIAGPTGYTETDKRQ